MRGYLGLLLWLVLLPVSLTATAGQVGAGIGGNLAKDGLSALDASVKGIIFESHLLAVFAETSSQGTCR